MTVECLIRLMTGSVTQAIRVLEQYILVRLCTNGDPDALERAMMTRIWLEVDHGQATKGQDRSLCSFLADVSARWPNELRPQAVVAAQSVSRAAFPASA